MDRAHHVDRIKRSIIGMAHKADGRQVHQGLRGCLRHFSRHGGLVGQVSQQGHYLVPSGLCMACEMLASEAAGPGQQDFQNENPAWLRSKSASTIIWHNCSSVVVGAQPSLALALAGSPISNSTSAGR